MNESIKHLWFRPRNLAFGVLAAVALLAVASFVFRPSATGRFERYTVAGLSGGFEVIGYHADEGLFDAGYQWHLRHTSDTFSRFLSAADFRLCDSGDTDWLRRDLASTFQLAPGALDRFSAYRGGTEIQHEYALVSPDHAESFYYVIHF